MPHTDRPEVPFPAFRPVILGSDSGVYSLARAFHASYGVRALVIAQGPRGPIADSRILQTRFTGLGAGHESVLEALREVARENARTASGEPDVLILLAGGEDHLDLIEEHRDELADLFVLPYASTPVMQRGRDKRGLYAACEELSLAYPPLAEIDVAALAVDDDGEVEVDLPEGLQFPVAVKPANSGAWSVLSFPGKSKAFHVADAATLRDVLTRVRRAGYQDAMLVQDFVPGDDTWGRTVTVYADQTGRVTMAASGQLLLGMHTPSMIGNSVAILTTPQPDLVAQVGRLVEHLGLRGFLNVDLKMDPRDGVARFLDLNTRIGRPNHYLLAAGLDPARAVVEDLVLDGEPSMQRQSRTGVYSPLPRWFLRRYLTSRDLRRSVHSAWKAFGPHPLRYRADGSWRRRLYRWMSTANLMRTFVSSYPAPREDVF